MMISRDVVLDLLPLYLADEASEDSKLLVSAYLQANPDFSRWVMENQAQIIPQSVISPSAQLEKETFMNFRKQQRKRSFLLALAIFFTAMPFSFVFNGSTGVAWWMIKDSPLQAVGFMVIAACVWVAYFWSDRNRSDRPPGGNVSLDQNSSR